MQNGTQQIEVRLTKSPDGTELERPVRLWVEARGDAGGEGEVSSRVVDNLTNVLDAVRAVSGQIADAVRELGPDKFTVTLGFEMKAEAGGLVAMLVRTGGSATIEVALEWERGRP